MKKYISSLFLLLILIPAFSQINQNGLPFMDKFSDKEYGDAGQIWAIEQDDRGVMYFGCNYGLKTFDGENWKLYNNPNSTIIRSLCIDESGLIYYGAEGDFGVLFPDSTGELSYYSLYLNYFKDVEIDFSSVWKTLIAGNRLYFQTFEKIFYLELPVKIDDKGKLQNEIKHIEPEKTMFHLAFSVNDVLYAREWEVGLGIVTDDRINLIPGGEQFAYTRIYIMLPYDENRILIGTRSSGFYLYDTTKEENAITPFFIEEQEVINQSTLYNGVLLHDGTYAIGTNNDGVIILDKNGKIVNHFNQKTGLPDQFIISTYINTKEKNSPFWFFNSDDGIYKVNVSNPFREWNKEVGLPNIPIMDVVRYNGILYVISPAGLYYLDETSGFAEFKLISEIIESWDLEIVKNPETEEEILLLSYVDGIIQIEKDGFTKISDISNAYAIYQSQENLYKLYIGNYEGLYLMEYENGKWVEKSKNPELKFQIKSILDKDDKIYLGCLSVGVIQLSDINDTNFVLMDSARGLPLEGQDFLVHELNNEIIVSSGAGLYRIEDSIATPYDFFGEEYCNGSVGVSYFFEDQYGYWIASYETNTESANHRLIRFKGKENPEKDTVFSKVLPKKPVFIIYPEDQYTWVGNERGLFKFDNKSEKDYSGRFHNLITKVTVKGDVVVFNGFNWGKKDNVYSIGLLQNDVNHPVLEYKNNKIVFEWAAPFYEKEDETVYSFRLMGENETWSKWDTKNDTRYTNLYEGEYTFEVKARNIYNIESTIAQYSFTILPPWYRTVWAYIIFSVLGILAIYVIIRLYTRKLKKENEKLEQIVKERTAEIRMQNEEITAQRDEIQAQKEQVEKAKDKIEQQQKSIMDSIHYASRIQEAVLPPDEYLREILGEHFVLFKPRDIVSGDFYWATQRGNKTVIVAADCTGHGVPGAFMSMLGISFLNEIVNKEEVLQANIILNRLRENVKRSLRQTGKENEAKDGMDLALCILDMDNMKLQFSGAYNPLYLLREGEIERVKADRMPIGIYLREKDSFTNNIIDIKKGDYLYIFSDGFVDQFGGPTDDKIKSANFKNLLLENSNKSPEEQKEALAQFLENWMAHKDNTGRVYKQVDDILVIGIEI